MLLRQVFENHGSIPKTGHSISQTLFGTDNIVIDILDFSTSNNTLDLYVRPYSSNIIEKTEIRLANIVPGYKGDYVRVINGNIYSGPAVIDFSSDETLENYKNNPFSVTYYDTQDISLTQYYLYDIVMERNTKY